MNLFDLFVRIGVKDEASGHLSELSQRLGNGLKTAAKIGTAAVGAASAGIVALTKSAIDNYAEYEQLVGGVDTLFKESSQKLQEYASEAYKNAGMSANDYMKNVTAFSASLIQSLGGDTEAAVEYANRAIVAMSDNANKMGSDIDSIVQTYQSLARGNFAMLDNLKLGYGGTKEELERLIADAATYTDVQREMGIVVDASSMSFDNIVNAIAVVQGHLGIAGATSQEASETISGSIAAMQAAWANLVTGIADENQDFERLIDNFVNSAATAAKNLLPRIGTALRGIGNLIRDLAPRISEALPLLLEDVLPDILTTAFDFVTGFIDGLIENFPLIAGAALSLVEYLVVRIAEQIPKMLDTGKRLLEGVTNGILAYTPTMIARLPEVINGFLGFITDNLPNVIAKGSELLSSFALGIISYIPDLILQLPAIISSIANFILDNLPVIFDLGIDLLVELGLGILDAIPELVASAAIVIEELVAGFVSLLHRIKDVGKQIVNSIKEGIRDAWDGLVSWFNNLWDSLFGNRTVEIEVEANEKSTDKSENSGVGVSKYKTGLAYVPYDDFPALLHEGERVLTAKENEAYTAERNAGGITVIQNIYSQAMTAADLMEEARYEAEKAVIFGV